MTGTPRPELSKLDLLPTPHRNSWRELAMASEVAVTASWNERAGVYLLLPSAHLGLCGEGGILPIGLQHLQKIHMLSSA